MSVSHAQAAAGKLTDWLAESPDATWYDAAKEAVRCNTVDIVDRLLAGGTLSERWRATVRTTDFASMLGSLTEGTVMHLLDTDSVDPLRALTCAVERGWARVIRNAAARVSLSDNDIQTMVDKLKRQNADAAKPLLSLDATESLASRAPVFASKCAKICVAVCDDVDLYNRFARYVHESPLKAMAAAAGNGRPLLLAHLMQAYSGPIDDALDLFGDFVDEQCIEILLRDRRVRGKPDVLRRIVKWGADPHRRGLAAACCIVLRSYQGDLALSDPSVTLQWCRDLTTLFLQALVEKIDSVVSVLRETSRHWLLAATFGDKRDRIDTLRLQSDLFSFASIERIELFLELASPSAVDEGSFCWSMSVMRRADIAVGARMLRAALRRAGFAPSGKHLESLLEWVVDQEPFEAVFDIWRTLLSDARFPPTLPANARVCADVLAREQAKATPNALVVAQLKSFYV